MSKQNREQNRTERAAAALEAERRRNRNRQLSIVGAVVAVLAVVVVLFVVLQPGSENDGDVSAAPAGATDVGLGVGDPEAPTEVIVYEDFLCPFCGQFEAATGDELAQLADDGEVYVEYRPINFLARVSDYSERATNAFAAVLDQEGPTAAKEFHDELFAQQPSEQGPFPDDDALVEMAVDAGASEDTIRPAIEDLELESFVEDATQQAADAGVQATPTVLVDGEPFTDGQTVEELASNLLTTIEQG